MPIDLEQLADIGRDHLKGIGMSDDQIDKLESETCLLCQGLADRIGMYQPGQGSLSLFKVPEGKTRFIFYKVCDLCMEQEEEFHLRCEEALVHKIQ